MMASTITPSTIRILGPGAAAIAQAPGSPFLDASGRVATIVPASNMANGVVYQIQVVGFASGVKDLAGNALQGDYQHNNGIRMTYDPDTVPPAVVSSNPPASATGIAIDVRPSVTLSEVISTASVSSSTVKLLGPGGAVIAQAAGSPSLDPTGATITLVPLAPLAAGSVYQIQVVGGAAGIKDPAGNTLAANWTLTPGFTTQPAAIAQSTNIGARARLFMGASFGPAGSEAGSAAWQPLGAGAIVPAGSTLALMFSEPLDPRSLTAGVRLIASGRTIRLRGGAARMSDDRRTLYLDPAGPLPAGVIELRLRGGADGLVSDNGTTLGAARLMLTFESAPADVPSLGVAE
jgi:hypothetical protein